MSWTCSGCGFKHDRWALRCPVVGMPQYPPKDDVGAVPPRQEWFGTPEPLRWGEDQLIGTIAPDILDPEWERAPMRPARLAVLVATVWMILPLGAMFIGMGATAAILLILTLLGALALGLAYWVLVLGDPRRGTSRGRPTRDDLQLLLRSGPFGWLREAFPDVPRSPDASVSATALAGAVPGGTGPSTATTVPAGAATAGPQRVVERNGQQVGRFRVAAPGRLVEVRMPAPDAATWPPQRGALVRVVGTWIEESWTFRARTVEVIEIVDPQQNTFRLTRPVIRSRRPLGWWVAVLILLLPGVLTGTWLASLFLGGS